MNGAARRPPAVEVHGPDVDASIGFVMRLGLALHTAGTPAPRLEEVLLDASHRLGLEGQFFTTPTSIFAAFGPVERQRTHLLRVEPGSVDLGKLAAIDRVARDVQAGRLRAAEGSARVDAVAAAAHPYHWGVRLLAYALASAVGCRFLGGGLAEVQAAGLVGLGIGLLSLVFSRFTLPSYLFEFAAAFLGSLIVSLLVSGGYALAISTATLAGIIIVLPGLTLTQAMTELTSRHLASGTARLGGAVVVLLALVVGVALAATLVTAAHGPLRSAAVQKLPSSTLYVALALAPLVFSLLLGARRRDLPWIYVASLVGYFGMQAGQRTLGPELGAAVGSLGVGLVANVYDRLRFGPQAVVFTPGVLLLVPGSLGFRSMTALLDAQTVAGIDAAFTMTLTAVALAAGFLLANVIVPLRRAKPS